jgi:hypothetical protein
MRGRQQSRSGIEGAVNSRQSEREDSQGRRSNRTRTPNGQNIVQIAIDEIRPSPENEKLYHPVDPDDPAVFSLHESIADHGVIEPIVVTEDGFILSGHRRHCAARMAGFEEVPCRIVPLKREDDIDRFTRLLREHNRQRVKAPDEIVREEVVSTDPAQCHRSLLAHRRKESGMPDSGEFDKVVLGQERRRKAISTHKQPFLEAVRQTVQGLRSFWPLSDRQIHYALLNNPPLRHAKRAASRYANNSASYQDLTDLLTRARLTGDIPWHAIADPTRPVGIWRTYKSVGPFVRDELDGFLQGYWRDYLQSQPNHIEIVAEKLTVRGILRRIAQEYAMTMTIGRGYCSIKPRYELACRYQRSGREKLVILFLCDFDPDGQNIAESFARSMRDDFGIEQVEPIQVALTGRQVGQLNLRPKLRAKKGSSTYRRFKAKHGDHVFELESVPPKALQELLRDAIESVIDREAFDAEIDAEVEEAAELTVFRERIVKAAADLNPGWGLEEED